MSDYDFDADDDVVDDNETDHDDLPETVAEGGKRTVDSDTVAPVGLDTQVIRLDAIDIKDAAMPKTGARLPRSVGDDDAKQQRRAAIAKANFDYSVLKEEKKPKLSVPIAANDNSVVGHRETESWPLMEQLHRTVFEPDAVKRQKFIGTVQYIRELVDIAGTDAMGLAVHRPGKKPTVDHDVDRSNSGKVYYHQGQTLDRKGLTWVRKNGEDTARRFDGAVRTSLRSERIIRDAGKGREDHFSERRLDAQNQLDDLAAVVGPLWLPLMTAVCENAGFTEIAAALGYKQPVAGNVIIKLALEVATKQIEAMHTATDFRQYVARHGLPVSASRYKRAMKTRLAA